MELQDNKYLWTKDNLIFYKAHFYNIDTSIYPYCSKDAYKLIWKNIPYNIMVS